MTECYIIEAKAPFQRFYSDPILSLVIMTILHNSRAVAWKASSSIIILWENC